MVDLVIILLKCNMCFLDVRDIIADDEALQAGVQETLQEYNLDQFITADVPGCEHQVCIDLNQLLWKR